MLDAFTSRTVKRWLSHASWIAPGGIIDSSVTVTRPPPSARPIGNETLPITMTAAKPIANARRHENTQPRLWKKLHAPW